ncbi:hypothetical protein LCGC14_1904440, partial [marine sediment metagenome]
VVETHYGELALATGAGAAEVDFALISYVMGIPTAVGISLALPTMLPVPVRLLGQPRLAGRIRKDTAASAAGGTIKLLLMEGLGT